MQHNDVTSPEVQAGVNRLVQFYEQLTPERLSTLNTCYAPDVDFKDPFNEVRGHEAIAQIFAHMFATLDAPRFVVTERVVQGQQAFLVWEFHFYMRRWRKGVPQCIRGGSFLRLDAHGLVLSHRDYWDAAEELYEKLPLLGRCMAWLRRLGAVTPSKQ